MASIPSRIAPLAAAAALVACLLFGCGGGNDDAVWQLPNSDLEGQRTAFFIDDILLAQAGGASKAAAAGEPAPAK